MDNLSYSQSPLAGEVFIEVLDNDIHLGWAKVEDDGYWVYSILKADLGTHRLKARHLNETSSERVFIVEKPADYDDFEGAENSWITTLNRPFFRVSSTATGPVGGYGVMATPDADGWTLPSPFHQKTLAFYAMGRGPNGENYDSNSVCTFNKRYSQIAFDSAFLNRLGLGLPAQVLALDVAGNTVASHTFTVSSLYPDKKIERIILKSAVDSAIVSLRFLVRSSRNVMNQNVLIIDNIIMVE